MKEFLRNFNKQKVVGLLNICSLSLGIMVAIIVGLWAINELSFDNFHKDKDHIYRVVRHVDFNNTRTKTGTDYQPMGAEAKERFPQIEELCRITFEDMDVRVNEKLYPNTRVLSADGNFFTFFSFELKEGDPKTILDAPNKIVLSENAAKRYFPDQNPIGQSMDINGNAFTVSGIMADMPKNSSIRSDIVTPFFGWALNQEWGSNDSYAAFLKIKNKADLPAINEGIKQIVLQAIPMFTSVHVEYTLEPLSEVHFSTGFLFDPLLKGNKPLVYIFILVALVILVISCINFTNLFISTSFLRARSIGIKKSQGASKNSLIKDFYQETAGYTFIAILVGIFLVNLFLPVFNNFTQSDLTIELNSSVLYIFLIGLFFFTVILAGTFPAFYMTRFNPIETLSGEFRGKKISFFQKSLLIIQFTASIALLIVVSFMHKQVDYMIAQDLGFDKENVIYVQGRGNFGKDFKAFQDEMLKDPSILNVTRKNSLPMNWQDGAALKRNLADAEEIVTEVNHVQENYFDFMHIQMLQGENPFYLESTDSILPIVLNERAAKVLGLENPIGEILILNEQHAEVKGVIKDLKVNSFHNEVHPQVYKKIPDNHWSRVLFFKITGDPQRAISFIREKWEKENPDYPFEYHFLDDTYAGLYTAETNSERVLSFAMLITFLISIAGLFAMAFYITQRRIKEIALRKINGATLKDLLLLLNKDFIIWTLLSFILACPIAYFALHKWLEGFTVKTALSVWIFLLTGIIALLVTILTTSFQTWKTANTNPVESLKIE